MKIKLAFNVFLITTIFSSCGVSKEEYNNLNLDYDNLKLDYDSLSIRNDSLITVIDEFENGEERLVALINNNYEKRNYSEAILNIKKLKERHPESNKIVEYESLMVKINSELEKEKNRIAKEEKEKFRLANLNNTGMWTNSFYVDEFGQRTNKAYIRNSNTISGLFSNSATTNSDLLVDILITDANKISFKLYEYAGENPVKAYGETNYSVLVLDSEGGKHNLNGSNYSDRITLDASSSRKLHGIFMKGDRIQFSIKEKRSSINMYNFTIDNANFYDNAFRKLQGK